MLQAKNNSKRRIVANVRLSKQVIDSSRKDMLSLFRQELAMNAISKILEEFIVESTDRNYTDLCLDVSVEQNVRQKTVAD